MAKTRRLQVLIEDEQWARLEVAAAERRMSVGAVVREAIERSLPGGVDERRTAAQVVLEAAPMAVPDPDALRDELEDLRGRRA